MNTLKIDEQIVKMQHITTIHMLEEKIGMEKTPFKDLEKKSNKALFSYVEQLVEAYNKKIKEQ
jgi:hypothetical protein